MSAATQTAYQEFILRAQFAAIDGGENICGYLTDVVRDKNNAIAAVWGSENLSGEADTADWWQICYVNCISKGYMKADPNYLNHEARVELFGKFNTTIPAAVQKEIWLNAPGYAAKLSQEQQAILARLGGQDGYRSLVEGGRRA